MLDFTLLDGATILQRVKFSERYRRRSINHWHNCRHDLQCAKFIYHIPSGKLHWSPSAERKGIQFNVIAIYKINKMGTYQFNERNTRQILEKNSKLQMEFYFPMNYGY